MMDVIEVVGLLISLWLFKGLVEWAVEEWKCSRKWVACNLDGPPRGLPFLGQLGNLIRHYRAPRLLYTQWANQYGPIYKVKLGSKLVVVLSSPEWITRVFAKTGTKVSYRVKDNILAKVIGNKGLVTADGDTWKAHRQFTLKAFRELEIGKESTHGVIYGQANAVANSISQQLKGEGEDGVTPTAPSSSPSSAEFQLGLGIFNILWYFIQGRTYSPNHPHVQHLFSNISSEMRASEMTGPWNFNIFIGIIWMLMCNPIRLLTSFLNRKSLVVGEIGRSRELFNNNYNNNNNKGTSSMTLMYLKAMEEESPHNKQLSDVDLEAFVSDLVVAGVETTFSALRWTLIFLATSPQIQLKLHEELDRKLEIFSLEELANYHMCRDELPYLEGVIRESLRLRPIIHTFCHTSQHDIHLDDDKGTLLPAQTWLFGNLWGVHMDELCWTTPTIFDPQRFLDPQGRLSTATLNQTQVFSVGSRKCPGEQLARMELYTFLVTLISRFRVNLDPSNPASLQPELGISLIPPPHAKLIFSHRSTSSK